MGKCQFGKVYVHTACCDQWKSAPKPHSFHHDGAKLVIQGYRTVATMWSTLEIRCKQHKQAMPRARQHFLTTRARHSKLVIQGYRTVATIWSSLDLRRWASASLAKYMYPQHVVISEKQQLSALSIMTAPGLYQGYRTVATMWSSLDSQRKQHKQAMPRARQHLFDHKSKTLQASRPLPLLLWKAFFCWQVCLWAAKIRGV